MNNIDSAVESGKEHEMFLLAPYMRNELINHTLVITTTYKCNLDCNYCPYKDGNEYGVDLVDNEDIIYSKDHTADITYESLDRTLKDIEENSDREFGFITIHGPGEPLLRWRQIVYFLDKITNSKIKNIKPDAKVVLMTNGALLGNQKIFEALLPYKEKIQFAVNNVGFNEFQYSHVSKFQRYAKNKEAIINNLKEFPYVGFKIILTREYGDNLYAITKDIIDTYSPTEISLNIDNNNPKLFKDDLSDAGDFISNLMAAWRYARSVGKRFYWTFDCCRDTKTYAHPNHKMIFYDKKEYCDYNALAGKTIEDPEVQFRFLMRDEYYNTVCKDCIAFGKCVPCLFALDHNEFDKERANWNDCNTIVLIETILSQLENEFDERMYEIQESVINENTSETV